MKCPDCGSKDVAQRRAANGQLYLIDTKRPHSIFCPGRKKGKKAPRRSRNGSKPVGDAVAESAKLLRDMNYTKAEAADMLKDIPEAAPEDMVLAALKRKGE